MTLIEVKKRLNSAYQALGLSLLEFDYQAIVRAHLGAGPLPVPPADEERALPFLITWVSSLDRSARIHAQSYDYGKRATREARPPLPGSPNSAPVLAALLDLLTRDGQDVGEAIDEFIDMQELIQILGTHIRAVKAQTDFSALAVRRSRRHTEWVTSSRAPLARSLS